MLGLMALAEKLAKREFHLSRYVAAYTAILFLSSFLVWRDEHLVSVALNRELEQLLGVDIALYERYPGEWGNQFTNESEMRLDANLKRLAMQAGQSYNFTPAVKAPDRLALENVQLFISFPPPMQIAPLKNWTLQSLGGGGTTVSQSLGTINQGSRTSTNEPIRWRCPVESDWLPIRWSVTSKSASMVTGLFLVDCKK